MTLVGKRWLGGGLPAVSRLWTECCSVSPSLHVDYFPSPSALTFCNGAGGGTAAQTQMESKKLFADEFSFRMLWKLGQFMIILQRPEIHLVKCFLCVCGCFFPPLPKHHGVICVCFSRLRFFFLKRLCFPGIARVWRFLMEKCSSVFGFSGDPLGTWGRLRDREQEGEPQKLGETKQN